EGSVELGIPGAFASSPVTVEGSQEPGPTTDELEEQYVEVHISITMGESIDEEQSELCPPGESSDDELSPHVKRTGILPCPTGSTPEPGYWPLNHSEEWDHELTLGYSSTPPGPISMESARIAKSRSTTPFHTPSRTSQPSLSQNTIRLEGAKYFPHNVLHMSNNHMETMPDKEAESENQSDETLKQSSRPKRHSEAQQRAEDMAFLNAVIKDNKRRRRLQEVLPDIIPNNKSLLDEMHEALEKSSGDEFEVSEWEHVAESPEAGPSKARMSAQTPEPNQITGPSFFDKGKWVSDEVHDAQEAYKAARRHGKDSEYSAQSKGRDKPNPKLPKTKPKKARPSMGITIDDIRPASSPKEMPKMYNDLPDLKASIAALPGGGYLAEKMKTRNTRLDGKCPGSPSSDSSSSSDDSSSDSESSTTLEDSSSSESSSSSGSDKLGKRRHKDKKHNKYREKNRQLRRKMRKAR
ncbi:hypothetical protein FRC11_011751, partial [Ceratobasidium sp. 423]